MVETAIDYQVAVWSSRQEIGLASLPPSEQIKQLKALAFDNYHKIALYQYDNGLIPASLGRHDDPHFAGKVWIKDNVRAIKFALNPYVQSFLPELGQDLYLKAILGMLNIQARDKQWGRFDSRPGEPCEGDYSTIDCQHAPAIKFEPNGELMEKWGHNQPDNWGTLLLEAGKGLGLGLPLLESQQHTSKPIGEILQKITSYAAYLRTERFICRSIWEHNKCWSSYSTRRIVLAGLEQIGKVWEKIEQDSHKNNYPLTLQRQEIWESAHRLREKVTEHFPADYTDSEGHESVGDLASLVVLHDIDLPEDEQAEIIRRTKELENRDGFYRYFGDPWKKGRAEAKWTMGKPVIANYYFKQAISSYQNRQPRAGFRALSWGLERMDDILRIKQKYGYIPELFEDDGSSYKPNNNELAWTLGYTIEAAASGIAAISTAEKYYQG